MRLSRAPAAVVLVLTVLWAAPAATQEPAPPAADRSPAGLEAGGAPGCPYRLPTTGLCTAGPDAPPPGVDVRQPVAPVARTAAAPPACVGDGRSGPRVQVLYARAADVPDRLATFRRSFEAWVAGADAIVDASAAETGGRRRLRVVHDAACALDVEAVELPATADDTFDATVAALRAAGHDRRDRVYLAFVDATAYCGIATVEGDDRPSATNSNNVGPAYGRVDAGCWNGHTVAHELAHVLGAVQDTAPNATGGGHCTDEWDVLCYSDEPARPAMRVVCADRSRNEALLDCGHDDYFSTSPAPGSYLDRHWNTADSVFLLEPGPTGTLRGSVRDVDGGRVDGAVVRLSGSSAPPTVTGPDGTFAFEAVPAGRYRLRADDGCTVGSREIEVGGDEQRGVTLRTARRDGADHVCTRRLGATPLPTTDAVDLAGDDESAEVALPFEFPFYGTTVRSVSVSTNGSLNVLGQPTPFDNVAVPDPSEPNGAVHAFWDDLAVDALSAVRTGVVGEAPARRFVVEWRDVSPLADRNQRLTAQAVLGEDGSVELAWFGVGPGELERGGSATVGIEGPAGRQGLGFASDAPVLRDGLAVRFRRAGGTPPTVVVTGPAAVASGQGFRLDAGATTDPEGDAVVFAWRQVEGPPAGLVDREGPSLAVPGVPGPATLAFRVRATDATGLRASATVPVAVLP